jgi:D-psicose/D-tagatose/L-ribulose 3-epimerase
MMLGDRPLSAKFAMAAEAGFDAIDLRGDLLHDQVDLAAECATDFPVATVYGRLPPLLAATAADRHWALDLLRTRLSDAAAVGAGRLVLVPIFGPPVIAVPDVETTEWALLAVLLSEVLAEDPAVTMVLEPLNAKETHFIRSPSQAAEFTRRIGHPRLATMLDTYHVDLEGQDAVAEASTVDDQLGLVHLSDRNRTLPGRGGIEFGPLLRHLADTGYDGYCGFECSGPFTVDDLADSLRWVRSQ